MVEGFVSLFFVIGSIIFLGLVSIAVFRRSVFHLLLSFEVLVLGICFFFFVLSIYLDDILFQLFVLVILGVAASESALGLTMLVLSFHSAATLDVEVFNKLKG